MHIFIIGFVVGGAVVYFFMLMVEPRKEEVRSFANDSEQAKGENLKKIEIFIADKDQFTNDDLQDLLGVSNTTVGRYLQELEKAGKIAQHGEIGSGVYYTKK